MFFEAFIDELEKVSFGIPSRKMEDLGPTGQKVMRQYHKAGKVKDLNSLDDLDVVEAQMWHEDRVKKELPDNFMFHGAQRRSIRKIALDISQDPKKLILQKQFQEMSKSMQQIGVGAQKQQEQKQPSVVYHVKVRPDGTVRGENRGPAQ